MSISVEASGEACGAYVTGVDLTAPLSAEEVAEIRAAWLDHHVLVFPDQDMSDDDLERYTLNMGPFGHDPFIAPIPGREHIIAVKRDADETAPIFAEVWHTDWSFQEKPPQGTCLFAITIPPVGGDTLFANQHKALEEMPDSLRSRLEGKTAIHSAWRGYSPKGLYGEAEKDSDRSMDIQPSEDAFAKQTHPLIRKHPETGRESLFGSFGYIIGLEGVEQEEADELLVELYQWQSNERFQFRQKWKSKMLVMWDNRSVLHTATAGYDGHARLLHRTTIGSH